MVVLKTYDLKYRVKASTLMETLVATILIVLIFVIASVILNNLFSNTIKNNTQAIDNHLNELQYLHQYGQLQLPHKGTFQNWDVSIDRYKENDQMYIEFEAINPITDKTITLIQREDQ